ncbi:vacuolar sorting VPS35 [Fusarium beomiforme]|uniref:Vacuolar sorting VPS35 n=1 Tax=Fusarium beomiforme TaxID=44412 RepID=A0A9P5E0M8_9HYPO|nr:vacuolar sorting VPS35 [Fusarium beomiforme]
MTEEPMLMRIPPEIRMLIYDYLLDNGGTKDISIRNQSKCEYEARRSKSRRSTYNIMERTIAKKSYETTYCADPHPRRSMHTAIMHINRKIREEASHFLYTKHAFHFGEDLQAVVPFLADKTPRTRDLVREISLYKRSPTNTMEPDSQDWTSVCRSLRSLQSLDKLTLVIEGARPRGPWDGPQSLTVSDFRLLYTTRHESLDWARELESLKTIKDVVIVADIHHLPHPESNMMLVLAAFSSSIDTSLVDFLRDDLGIPARSDKMATPAPPEDQARLLEDALVAVRQQTSLMRKCLDTPGKLMDALKCCSTLVSELRTSSLGPKQYYELYMSVFDALRYLSVHLRENHPVNHLADLYELVQYAGNIVPRLYLMITVGTAYMAIEDAPVKELMKDMMDMSRGVQHPIRGLFLRYYLSGQARDYLPTTESDGPEGNISDSINFVLTNFVEMNKLWVRLQHQGHSREREQRIRERKELQLLVGSNIVRLSQLVDLETYKSSILAPLLEQVVQCRDVLAQEYLLEVITQVFPDEFHLHTLDQFLGAVSRLNPHVNVKAIVIGLMDRLSEYAERDGPDDKSDDRAQIEADALAKLLEKVNLQKELSTATASESKPSEEDGKLGDSSEAAETADADKPPVGKKPTAKSTDEATEENTGESSNDDSSTLAESTPSVADTETTAVNGQGSITDTVQLYEVFFAQVKNLVEAQHLPVQDIIALLVSLCNLALNIYPDRLDYVDQILAYATAKVRENINNADLHSPPAQQSLLALLQAPLSRYVSPFTALSLPTYVPLFQSQSYPTRRAVAGGVARTLLKNQTKISTTEQLENVLEVLKVLIKEGSQAPQGYPGVTQRRPVETDETMEEQGWLARIVHLLHAEDNDTQFKLLQMTRKAYSEGNERIRTTTPPLITACMKLARKFKQREHFDDNWETQSNALFKFMHSALSTLYTRVNGSGAAEMALRLFASAGQTADLVGFEEVAYEFFAQAFTVYEEAVSDSKAQFQAVCVIATALHQTRNFGKENYDTLITKCAQHGSKLLRKPDQCRAVYLASHLWWATPIVSNGESEETELYRDGKRVLECLQRALRVADSCMETATSIELFVEILDRYVYYFDQQNESVTTKYLNGLIELIHSNLAGNQQDSASVENSRRHFHQTLENIRSRQYEGVVLTPN